MNQLLFDFYQGTGKDIQGRTLQQMLEMTDRELERSHTVIQWLFPLTEPSQHNPDAPLLDEETIQAMKQDEQCIKNIFLSGQRFWNFLTSNRDNPHWIQKRDHNFLRITRIIKCYRLFNNPLVETFYKLANYYYKKFPEIIGKETKKFWDDAFHSDI